VTHPDMGYTTSRPTLIKNRQPNAASGSFSNPAVNNWYLVFGSGPHGSTSTTRKNALNFGISDQTGKVFVYDLQAKDFAKGGTVNDSFDVAEASTGLLIGMVILLMM